MSDRALLVGATGLVGTELVAAAGRQDRVRLTGLARREKPLPRGARLEMLIDDPAGWDAIIADLKPDILFCALGTTMAKAGGDKAAFRAVDRDLVLSCARAAAESGARQAVVVSSIGANAASRSFYLSLKGEVEREIGRMAFGRVDCLRPGLLRGDRGDDPRTGEGIAMKLAPFTDLLMHGPLRQGRSIAARDVARAMLALAGPKADGRFVHDRDAMLTAIARSAARQNLANRPSSFAD